MSPRRDAKRRGEATVESRGTGSNGARGRGVREKERDRHAGCQSAGRGLGQAIIILTCVRPVRAVVKRHRDSDSPRRVVYTLRAAPGRPDVG